MKPVREEPTKKALQFPRIPKDLKMSQAVKDMVFWDFPKDIDIDKELENMWEERAKWDCFLDSNIVIDFYAHREPFFSSAWEIFELAEEGIVDIVVSSLTIINLAYVLRKAYSKDIIAAKLMHLTKLSKISKIDSDIIKEAIERQSYDFEDCVQFLSSKTKKIDVIITRDKKGFADLDVPYMTAKEFIAKCQE